MQQGKGLLMCDETITRKTRETANILFGEGIKMDPPYLTWKAFDKELANDFSKFITGNLYSRTVLSLPERQMVACAILAATKAHDELKLHVNAALNVGCDRRKIAEIFFQMATYTGMPAVNEALAVYREVLQERGEWPIGKKSKGL
jgi:4-carboxymuconolactone decarboxylase